MALDFTVNDKFFDANFSCRRYIIHQGGTGAGKTYSILQHLLTCAYYVKGLTISVVAESMPHLARGCLRDTRKIINDNCTRGPRGPYRPEGARGNLTSLQMNLFWS